MQKQVKKFIALSLTAVMAMGMLSACSSSSAPASTASDAVSSEAAAPSEAAETSAAEASAGDPIKISVAFSDNPTLPFKSDWATIVEVQKRTNTTLEIEAIPMNDFTTKTSLMLNTGENTPDVIFWMDTLGENASLALNGAVVPISDYTDWTPNFNKFVEDNNMQADLDMRRLADGKFYFLPTLYDKPFYDGGLLLREDFLEAKGLDAPKTFDDLYEILKAYKDENPDSYPLTILAAPRVLYRMTMPSFGISLSKNASTGSHVLSWDYDKKEYFAGAISDQYKEYISMLAKWYAEGLIDPEMAEPIDGDKWTTKMATGSAIASYAYYDQIGGIVGNSTIEGIKFNMYPPLEGPAGAHHQPKSRTDKGILFPAKTAERADFEQVVRAIDEMFYSPENIKLWCLGVEGDSYTEENGKYVFNPEVADSPDGLFKAMQLKYGTGANGLQMVWINEMEMFKYDENYARINKEVAAMDDAIQTVPPSPQFDDIVAEEAKTMQSPLGDAFDRWINDFLTGNKSVENNWDAYVEEMKTLRIEEFCDLYNSHKAE